MEQELDLFRYRDLEVRGYGSRVTIWRAVKEGTFPPPIDDGRGRPAWLKEDIQNWKSSRQHMTPAAA